MSSICSISYGAEASVDTPNVLDGLDIVGMQSQTSFSSKAEQNGASDLMEKATAFDFINAASPTEIFDPGAEGVSETVDAELAEKSVEEVLPGFGRETSELEFFPSQSTPDTKISLDGAEITVNGSTSNSELEEELVEEDFQFGYSDNQDFEIF